MTMTPVTMTDSMITVTIALIMTDVEPELLTKNYGPTYINGLVMNLMYP